MTDFEHRLTDALEREAAAAPDTLGLADRARRRARNRRRTRAGLVAGLVVAVVAIPTGIVILGGEESPGRSEVAVEPTPSVESGTDVPAGWKVETWRGLSVLVPGDWETGTRGSYCAGSSPEEGRIDRPGTPGRAIACSNPEFSFGLSFGTGSAISLVYPSGHVWQYEAGDIEMYASGSWLGYWYDDDRLVQVNAGDRETVQRILDSVLSMALTD